MATVTNKVATSGCALPRPRPASSSAIEKPASLERVHGIARARWSGSSAGYTRAVNRRCRRTVADVAAAASTAKKNTPRQREQPVGHDSGFLWRFNNYCAIEERAEGTVVQCESISLSRDIPFGLGWLIGPFVSDVPRESLEFTLGAIRKSVTKSS